MTANIFLFTALAIAIYFFFVRNTQVYFFQTKISDGAYGNLIHWLDGLKDDDELIQRWGEYLKKKKMVDKICDKYSYARMIFSFRPLKLEYWYDEEEIAFINEGGVFIIGKNARRNLF